MVFDKINIQFTKTVLDCRNQCDRYLFKVYYVDTNIDIS